MIRNTCIAFLTGASVIALAASGHCAGSEVFGGFTGSSGLEYGTVGGVTALNRDSGTDGFLARADAGYGQYSYDRRANPGIDADMTDIDLMGGYRKFFGNGRVALYIGGDYENTSLNKADAQNSATGSKFGIKGAADARFNFDDKTFADLTGSYSTAFNTYWSNVRLGYNLGRFAIGPEAGFLGNDAFGQQRIGGFIGDIHIMNGLTAGVSAGYARTDLFSDGAYGSVSVALTF
jgi:hypothetical protein